jgi:EAL and modified HD-GYP domain-containing signal transduction protein
MPSDLDSRTVVCVARQPILDRAGRVYGYELLYRDGLHASTCPAGDNLASSRVFSDAVLSLGLEKLTGGKPAFVNFTRDLLLSGAARLVRNNTLVIEILETVNIDAEVIAACRALRGQGYSLALDDFVPGSDAEQLIPCVKYVKIDVLQTTPAERAKLAERFRSLGISLVAEKVETREMADAVLANGYRFAQGYYYCRPTTFAAQALPARRLAHLSLFAALNRSDLTVDEVEDLVKHDVSLSYRILRSINSAAYSLRREIESIRQALVLLGVDQIRKWAAVWTLAGLNEGGTPETVTVALLRARSCEVLGILLANKERGELFFLLGLCSLLDAIVGRPMTDLLKEMPLPVGTKDALLGQANQERSVLDAVIAYENGLWDEAASAIGPLGLKEAALPDAYADALKWARGLSVAA